MVTVKNSYETVLVISTKIGDEAISGLVQKFKELIEANATLDSFVEWGKRKLAYEINKETEGHYVLFTFTSSPDFPAELDRIYKITDGILRSLIIKKD
ncbi:MAG: 30S ribosomal protein S6 [Eubacteriales bacterium SKADARSKE-1]|nr:30S ribosomal protein S6 [Eubacteriales bacterium SKADARSKE-1]